MAVNTSSQFRRGWVTTPTVDSDFVGDAIDRSTWASSLREGELRAAPRQPALPLGDSDRRARRLSAVEGHHRM